MNKLLPLLLFVFTTTTAFSSSIKSESQFPNYGIMQYFIPAKSSLNCINKPLIYTNEKFLPGKIITKSNEVITPSGLRYNIVEDVIECQFKTQHSRISAPQKLSEVEIDGTHYVYKKFVHKGDSLSGYLQQIHSGTKNLYVKHLFQAPHSQNDNWNIKKIFFVEYAGNLPKKVNSLKTEINRIYEGKESMANAFMRKNNYSWNDAKALIKLVSYLDKLSSDNVASR
ncbi:hypothetical protein [Marinifilum caeruleilacunae]|uniref:DUF4468 domain-containing protein n=1 Tax=Marinifilum caeruleilacunae TaxID=2499076 RepID=A0ABX1WSD4_9BACT|nr:hypothetical protein [Marinifilum caeruleilacunae]NOU58983.1 hypothetical protein [Marinifilum caeruleilacunae]